MRAAHVTFTRSRPGNSNDGAHVEQKNWAVVRTGVGYHRYDTAAELLLLNEIWVLQSKITNFFLPQQKLISKVRDGAEIAKKYAAMARAVLLHRGTPWVPVAAIAGRLV